MNIIAELQDVVWTLNEGIELVRVLQPHTRRFGYHLALGGGVVNKGYSKKDLDLYFLPLGERGQKPLELLEWLRERFGSDESIMGYGEGDDAAMFIHKVKFENGGKRVDAFIAASLRFDEGPKKREAEFWDS